MLTIKRLSLYGLLLLCAFKAHAQQTVQLFYEKVYLHTDRSTYTPSEDIWFKAYLVDAQNNKPINYSRNLYVELISPRLNITIRHVIRLENGLANGDFKLPDTLSTGQYRIRAYTNYMRNFGDHFIFEKNISIVNTGTQPVAPIVQKPVKRLRSKPVPGFKADTLPTGPIVRFFPEGGFLVDNVRSTVAVRAEDEWGRGIAVNGQVFASSGRAVAKFTCDSLGMGSFTLQPDESQQYHAEVSIKGQPLTFKLPETRHKGFVLSANTAPGAVVAEISCNGYMLSEAGGSDLIVTLSHGGKIYHKQRFTISSKTALVQMPDVYLPEGIACVTLFDEFAKPLAERLIYVSHPNTTKAVVTTDKAVYGPKEAVIVRIKLSDTARTNLSLAVVDAGIVPVQPENILSYLTLKSELKGTIEHPERYFDTTNVNRFKQLDLLLLTQGWRNFLWKAIADSIPKITYDVEQSITLTGRVRKVWNRKSVPDINITMFAPKADKEKLFSAVTDTTGRFTINGAILYGYQLLYFTSRKSDGIAADGTSEGKSGGWIQVDSLFQDRLPVKATLAGDALLNKSDSLAEKYARRKKFSFTGVNELKAVQIKSYSPILPPLVYPITLTEQKDYESLLNFLLYNIPGSYLSNNFQNPKLMFNRFDPICVYVIHVSSSYVDGSPIPHRPIVPNEYFSMRMSNIIKVNINRRMFECGIYYSVSLILRPGALDVKDTFDNTVADVTGYTKARTFFAPRYETPSDNADYRTTIHWEPNITTNANGEATVTYYNADPKTKISLIVQGITDKGMPVVASSAYEVK